MFSGESVEPAGLLKRGAAAEVDEAAGHGGRAAPAANAFEHEDVGTQRGSLGGRGYTGHAVADDHDVGLVAPGANVRAASRPGRADRHRVGRHVGLCIGHGDLLAGAAATPGGL